MDQPVPLPFETLPSPPYRPRAGRWLTRLGALVIAIGLVASGILYLVFLVDADADPGGSPPVAILGLVVVSSFALFLSGVWLIHRGRRMRALPAARLMQLDARPPILFLRSFDDDDLIDPTPRMVPLGDYFPRRYEESIAEALRPLGPTIAIGRPGESIPLLGAGRLFVPDHAWQAAVDHLRGRAAAVVVMVGRSQGIWWEILSTLDSIDRERVLFFFPYVEDAVKRRSILQRIVHVRPANMPVTSGVYRRMERERQGRYRLFRERVEPRLPHRLPETLDAAMFIDVLPGGTPRALPTVRPWWRPVTILTPSVRRMVVDYERTLQPFVDKLASRAEGPAPLTVAFRGDRI